MCFDRSLLARLPESMSQRERWKLGIISSPTFWDLFYKKLLVKTETLAIKTHLVRGSGHQAKVYHKIALEMSKRCEILTISQKRWPGLLPISQKLIFTKFHNFHRDLKVSCWSGFFITISFATWPRFLKKLSNSKKCTAWYIKFRKTI